MSYNILLKIRMPRLILGMATEAPLSLAAPFSRGCSAIPWWSPIPWGISGGASLGVCLNILFKWHLILGIIAYPLSGFLGPLPSLPWSTSSASERAWSRPIPCCSPRDDQLCLLLPVMLLMAVSKSDELQTIVFWIMGSLDETNLTLIKICCAGSVTGLVISLMFCLDLNALALGEEEALNLGINIERSKKVLFVTASILTGISVSVGGIIMFAGLIVPHFMRLTVGSDHRILLPGSFLAGAAFLTLCDVIARTVIAPLELPVGVITGIIGGVVFIYVLTRKRGRA